MLPRMPATAPCRLRRLLLLMALVVVVLLLLQLAPAGGALMMLHSSSSTQYSRTAVTSASTSEPTWGMWEQPRPPVI